MQRLDEYGTLKDWWLACSEAPQDTKIAIKWLENRPDNWPDNFHRWPEHGILAIAIRMPSSNRSATQR
jgi:hypothetical protein